VNVTVRIPLTAAEKQKLAEILGCSVVDLKTELSPVALAGLSEHVEMFLGRKVFTRGSDMREYRLFLLIKERYRNRLPTEDELSSLFQTTASQSHSLLRAVMSKYQYELSQIMADALRRAVNSFAQPPNAPPGADWHLDAESEYVVEALNHRIGTIGPSLTRLTREQGTASRYIVKPATRQSLRTALSL
jgi:CHAD domain-containing protein